MKYLIPLVFLALPVQARDITFEWDLATQRIDGTALTVAEIAATRIEWGTCVSGAFGVQAGTRDIAPPPVTTVVALAKGTHCVRAYTVDTEGLVSDPTPVLQVQVKERPKPPSGPRVR